MLSLARAVPLLLCSLLLLGCSRGSGPADELKRLFEAVASPEVSPSRLSDELYRVLDERSRQAIDARAKAIGEKLGTTVAADEILQVRGTVASRRVTKVEVLSESEDRATLSLVFEPIVFGVRTQSNDPASAPTSMKIDVVKEAGRWRVAFTDLGKLVAELPLEASAGGPR